MEEDEIIEDNKLGDQINVDLDFLLEQEVFDENQPNQLPFDNYFEGEEKYDFLLDTSSNQSNDNEGNEKDEDGDDDEDDDDEEDNQESKILIAKLT